MDQDWTSILPTFIRKRLGGRQNLQSIIANTSWLFADKILRMGVGLIVSVWTARYLGPDQFGAFNFAIAFAALFGTFASLGLDGIVIRDIVRRPELKFQILSSAFILKLCGGGIAFFISLVSIYLMRPTDSQAQLLVGIIAAGMIIQSFDAIDLWFQSQVQSKYTVLAKGCAFIMLSLVRVFLILNKQPLITFAYAVLAEIIIGAAGLVIFYMRQQAFSLWHPRMDTCRRLLFESWPAILSGLTVMIYFRIDQIMLAQMADNRAVGIYTSALRFSEIWYFIPGIIVSSIMPGMTQLKLESEELYLQRMQQLFNSLAKMAYVIAFPMSLFAPLLMSLCYGNAYAGAGVILTIHIWTTLFVFIGVGMSPWLLNEGLLKYSLIQAVAGALVNICLNIVLIPRYEGVGAAIATLASQIIASFVSNIATSRMRIIFKMQLRALVRPVF